jgi:thioredoxin 1
MKKLKSLLILAVALVLVSCSMSAKTEKKDAVEPKAQGEVIVLNKADFLSKVFNYEKNKQWAYAGDKPCVIDFYADWCGPCRQMAPIMKELAGEYKGKVIFYKINVDNEQELAAAFGVQSIPMILFIPKTGTPQASLGVITKDQFVQRIGSIMQKK